MAILLSLGAALAYGAADFAGGLVTRRTHVLTVVFLSQGIGSAVFALLFPLFPDAPASSSALGWGALAGAGGASGVSLLYRGLARGRMSVVAPVTAVVAAGAPVAFGLLIGERPSRLALAGVLVALIAVVLISSVPEAGSSGPARRVAGLPEAVGAGVAFAAFFILLDRAGPDSGLWPLVGARVASLAIIGTALVATRRLPRPGRGTLSTIAAVGALDVAANQLFLLATRSGLLSLVAVLTSMYPASTVLLARTVLNERLARPQVIGLGCAAAGVGLIALG
jgi:drug/metabolite transporter (DMT)-like permease